MPSATQALLLCRWRFDRQVEPALASRVDLGGAAGIRVGERTDRNAIIPGRSSIRRHTALHKSAKLSRPNCHPPRRTAILARFATDRTCLGPGRLNQERAPGAPLAIEAMAQRNPHRSPAAPRQEPQLQEAMRSFMPHIIRQLPHEKRRPEGPPTAALAH